MAERKVQPKDTAAKKPKAAAKKGSTRETKGAHSGQARSTRDTKIHRF